MKRRLDDYQEQQQQEGVESSQIEGPLNKKLKRSFYALLDHIPESVIRYEIFSFVHPLGSLSLLLSCSKFYQWMQENNCFKYSKLLKGSSPIVSKQLCEGSLPSFEFFNSKYAQIIQTIFNYSAVRIDVRIPVTVFTQYEEHICRELMKILPFDINSLNNVNWFEQDRIDLITIFTTKDKKQRMKLIEQYQMYIPTAFYGEEQNLTRLCIEYIEDVEDRNTLLMIAKNAETRDVSESILEHIPLKYTKDKEIVMHVVSLGEESDLCYASEELRNDKEVVMTAIKRIPDSIQYASEELREDREVCLAAVEGDYECLEWELYGLTHDKDIMLHLMKNVDIKAFQFISSSLLGDRDIMLEAITVAGDDYIIYISISLEHDRTFVLECVTRNGLTLRYFQNSFQEDIEIVSAAVKNDGNALEFASLKLKGDKEIVSLAVSQTGNALNYASERLKDDLDFVKSLDRSAFPYASLRLRNDKECVLFILHNCIGDPMSIVTNIVRSISKELRDDEEVMMAAVSASGYTLRYGSDKIKANRVIVLKAIADYPKVLYHAAEYLKRELSPNYLQ